MIAIQTQKKELQELFHQFIEKTQSKPSQAELFPIYIYMEQSLKKSFKLLKKISKITVRPQFMEFWKQLSTTEQINYYSKSVDLLKLAVDHKKPQQPIEREEEVFYRKSIISNWQKRRLRLTAQYFLVTSQKKNRLFDLKNYSLRKSKNKDFFGWVLEVVEKTDQKSIHFGVSNVQDFQDWYKAFQRNIQYIRVQELDRSIDVNQKSRQMLQVKPPLMIQAQSLQLSVHNEQYDISETINTPKSEKVGNKTLTQIVLHNEMKVLDDRVQFQAQSAKRDSYDAKNLEQQYHPNIFSRLMPEYNLDNFVQVSPNANLLQFQDQFRICQQPADHFMEVKIKMIMVLPYPKSMVFQAITNSPQLWNPEIDIFNIKTAIKSQNAAIIYEKHKPQGLLYRQRDFLYLRHSFSLQAEDKSTKQLKAYSYIIDKSIDSVNFPPFMTVARGEKLIIYCIVASDNDKQCLLTIQGFVKGGGYMSQAQNKQMTIKQFKNFLLLQKYLKQKVFTANTIQQTCFFQENWKTVFKNDQKKELSDQMVSIKKKEEFCQAKTYSIDQQKERQLEEFLVKSAQHSEQFKEEHDRVSSSELLVEQYKSPPINPETQEVIISTNYLLKKHQIAPKPKSEKPAYFPHFRGHHLYQGQWEICQNGGLTYIDEDKMRQQRKVLTYIIKRIGRNILSGKGILNISLPVDIFCRQSNIQRLAMSYGYCPVFLEKAAKISQEQQQLKYVVCASISSSLIYLTFQKPFNPILGETYQCWIDGCPIYFEQISHHPPIASFFMKGRGYQIYGSFQAKMQLSINSGKGMNEGITTVKFDNGNTFYYILAGGQLSGLTYGPRKLNFVGKATYWTKSGLFCEMLYNPAAKNKKFFGSGPSYTGEQKLSDYTEGFVKRYEVKDIEQIIYTKKNNFMQRQMIIPKGAPTAKPIKDLYKIYGRVTKYLICNGEKLFDADETRYHKCYDEENPLPSHSNYREDIVYRRLNDVVKSQNWKQKLEVIQRNDRKFRQQFSKKY